MRKVQFLQFLHLLHLLHLLRPGLRLRPRLLSLPLSRLIKPASPLSPKFKHGFPERDVFLLGNPRSGTTWVMNLIASMPGYRSAFEPLAHRGKRGRGQPQTTGTFRRNQADLKACLQSVLSEPYPDNSPFHRLSAIRRPFASQTVVKLVDANDLLGWLAENFRSRLLLIRRSPLAVLKSRLRLGWFLPDQLKALLENSQLMEGHLRNFRVILESLLASGSEAERFYARTWLENWLGSRLAHEHHAVICDYEELVANPLERSRRMFRELGFEPPPALADMLRRPSDTSWPQVCKAVLSQEEEQKLAELELTLASTAKG